MSFDSLMFEIVLETLFQTCVYLKRYYNVKKQPLFPTPQTLNLNFRGGKTRRLFILQNRFVLIKIPAAELSWWANLFDCLVSPSPFELDVLSFSVCRSHLVNKSYQKVVDWLSIFMFVKSMFTFNHVFEFQPMKSFIIVYQSFFNSSVTNDNQTVLDVKRKIVFVTFIGQFAHKKIRWSRKRKSKSS